MKHFIRINVMNFRSSDLRQPVDGEMVKKRTYRELEMTFSNEASSRQEVWMDKKRRKSASWNVLATAIFAAIRTIGRRPFRFRNPSVVSADIIALIYPEESAPNGRFTVVDRPGDGFVFIALTKNARLLGTTFPLSLASFSLVNQFLKENFKFR